MATSAKSLSALSIADINESIADEPRILDLTVAKRLGYASPPMIRKLIERNADELAAYGVLSTMEKTSGDKGGRPGTEYWLTEGQALLVCMFSRTPQAAAVRKEVIDVFTAWRAGHLKPSTTPIKQQNQDDVRAANRLAYDWSQRDFRRYQAWLHAHLQKLREAGWTDSADAALAQLSVDPLLIGRPTSQGPLSLPSTDGRYLLVVRHGQLAEIKSIDDSCVVNPDNPANLATFLREFVPVSALPTALQVIAHRSAVILQYGPPGAPIPPAFLANEKEDRS